MRYFKNWQSIIQLLIITSGLFIGAHFSKISYLKHEESGHGGVKDHKAMNHGTFNIIKKENVPMITDFQITKDPMSGWNLYFDVANFRLAPEKASLQNVMGEGHAHLYLNGVKLARLYSNWYHIPELSYSENEFKITLNTNDHRTLAVDNQSIEKVIVLKE